MFSRYSFGINCGSFQFIPKPPVVFSALFSVDILPFPSLTHFIGHFLCNPCFFAPFSTFPTKSLIVSNTHSFRLFHCSSHSQFHFQLHQVSLLGQLAFLVTEYILSPNPILVFCFGIVQCLTIWYRSCQLVPYFPAYKTQPDFFIGNFRKNNYECI
jgi:hypothetical protein